MKPKHIYSLTEGEPLNAGRKKNECRNERYPVGVESESHGRAEIRIPADIETALFEDPKLMKLVRKRKAS